MDKTASHLLKNPFNCFIPHEEKVSAGTLYLLCPVGKKTVCKVSRQMAGREKVKLTLLFPNPLLNLEATVLLFMEMKNTVREKKYHTTHNV